MTAGVSEGCAGVATIEPSVRPGMGARPFGGGTSFRVWAPNATAVHVTGSFNAWEPLQAPLAHEGQGYWSADVAGAAAGDEYKFVVSNGNFVAWRKDPYARDVRHSNGNCVIFDPASLSQGTGFQPPTLDDLVIYEMHLGTFNDQPGGPSGSLQTAIERLPHVAELGANAIQVMPLNEFPGSHSWGYNPSDIFAVETDYGGPEGFAAFVQTAHGLGLAVIVDVVYNHLGPSDLDLWQFDGWQENGKGGIYFYNDWRCWTLWGETRPDYGRPEVRQFLRDSAMSWLENFGADGLRWDMTLYIRTVYGNPQNPGESLADGWRLMQRVNGEVRARWPGKISIAEDMRDEPGLTRSDLDGGAGFHAQWGAAFAHAVRDAIIPGDDGARDLGALGAAISASYDGDAFRRVVYTESHDEVANGRARVPHEVWPGNAGSWFSRKRSTLGAVIVFTAPGVPMLFQGQEFLEDEWFRDTDPLDWSKRQRFQGIFRLYQDLVRMRLDRSGGFAGLRGHGVNVFHSNHADKMLAYHRWDRGGPGDDTLVVLNLANRAYGSYGIGFPRGGWWRVRFNSDWSGYSDDFGDHLGYDTFAHGGGKDGLAFHGNVGIGPYSALVLTQD